MGGGLPKSFAQALNRQVYFSPTALRLSIAESGEGKASHRSMASTLARSMGRVMKAGQTEFVANDDAAPVDMLAALFEARGWPFQAVSDDEMSGEIQGSWAKYQLRCIWRSEDNVLQLLCLPDIRVAEEKRSQAFELVAMVNEQMWLGHFDVWSNGGILLYRNGAMLGDEGLLSLDQAQALVETAVEECDRFYPAFQFVLWGDKSPQEALENALVDAAGEA